MFLFTHVITNSQCFVIGNISIGWQLAGLNGRPGYFFVGGPHIMAASHVSVPQNYNSHILIVGYVHLHVVFVHYRAGFFIFVAQRELACCFLHRQSIVGSRLVSDVMLLIARALVLLICGFVLSFLFSLVVIHCHCYFKSKEAMITSLLFWLAGWNE